MQTAFSETQMLTLEPKARRQVAGHVTVLPKDDPVGFASCAMMSRVARMASAQAWHDYL